MSETELSSRRETELSITYQELETELNEPIRIVHLTDLHGREFGEANQDLVSLVLQRDPDLRVMTGDMLDKQDESADVICELIGRLSEIAPVFYGYGNHEYEWMREHEENLTPVLTEAGATVLDVAYLDIAVNGQRLRIGGYHGYYRQPHMYLVTDKQQEAELSFCESFEDTDQYKISLSHIPPPWLDWEYIDRYPVDLILAGHYHGGQIRLPLLDGLYAPYVGLFPEYTEGMFVGEQAACILSVGLGYSPGIPRINNLPQIVVVDLVTENT